MMLAQNRASVLSWCTWYDKDFAVSDIKGNRKFAVAHVNKLSDNYFSSICLRHKSAYIPGGLQTPLFLSIPLIIIWFGDPLYRYMYIIYTHWWYVLPLWWYGIWYFMVIFYPKFFLWITWLIGLCLRFLLYFLVVACPLSLPFCVFFVLSISVYVFCLDAVPFLFVSILYYIMFRRCFYIVSFTVFS